jgi:hypothetical protein
MCCWTLFGVRVTISTLSGATCSSSHPRLYIYGVTLVTFPTDWDCGCSISLFKRWNGMNIWSAKGFGRFNPCIKFSNICRWLICDRCKPLTCIHNCRLQGEFWWMKYEMGGSFQSDMNRLSCFQLKSWHNFPHCVLGSVALVASTTASGDWRGASHAFLASLGLGEVEGGGAVAGSAKAS